MESKSSFSWLSWVCCHLPRRLGVNEFPSTVASWAITVLEVYLKIAPYMGPRVLSIYIYIYVYIVVKFEYLPEELHRIVHHQEILLPRGSILQVHHVHPRGDESSILTADASLFNVEDVAEKMGRHAEKDNGGARWASKIVNGVITPIKVVLSNIL